MFDNVSREKNILDLVTFDDVKISYCVAEDLQVIFTIDPSVCASTRDWIGIYQAGWNAFESCITYHWGIGRHYQNSCRTRCMTFKARDLTKAKSDTHYQFVYVNRYLEILGVSQYFQFRAPETPLRSLSSKQKINASNGPLTPTSPVCCKLASPERVDNIFTTCGRCENLFELNNEANSYRETALSLSTKVKNLETSIAKLQSTSSNQIWNEEAERSRFHKFLADVYSIKPDGSGEKYAFPAGKLDIVRRLVTAMDNIITAAENVKIELLKIAEVPKESRTDHEMVDPNVSGIQPIPEEPPRTED